MQQSADGKQPGRFLLIGWHGKFLVLGLMLGFFLFFFPCAMMREAAGFLEGLEERIYHL